MQRALWLFGWAALVVPSVANALFVNINAGAGLVNNLAAMGALQRGAMQWEARIGDPITVNLVVDLISFSSPQTIGEASSRTLTTTNNGFNIVRNALVADAATEADDAIVSSLPTLAQFSATLPAGFSRSNELAGTKANFKALGFSGLDSTFGATDAEINFNSQFSFDFDKSNGVSAGTIDFETVAAHEIGHALGFISAVDTVDVLMGDNQTAVITPMILDLFRFSSLDNPSTASEFTDKPRNLIPGDEAFIDDLTNEFALSTGRSEGDGRQASHFKADELLGFNIGIMDPTLSFGSSFDVSEADLRVLDLMGFDITPIPLPPSLPLALTAILFVRCMRSRPSAAPAGT